MWGGETRGARGFALILSRRGRRGGRGRPRPCSDTEQSNRKGRERPARGEWAGLLGQLARVGRSPSGAGAFSLSAFPFSFFFFFFFNFSSFCIFFLANNDFAKLCHWPKQFQRIIGHCHKKIVRLLK